MLRTIILLIATLIALPIVVYYQNPVSFSDEQWATMGLLGKIMLGTGLSCFAVSEWSRNYSQVDKLWSIMPIVYVWIVAAHSGMDQRVVLMAVLATLWGVRLTYNFARRGAYTWPVWAGEEDYRWGILRQQPHLQGRLRWGAFNLFFISLYQNALILLFSLPVVAGWQGAGKPLHWLDYLAATCMLASIIIETIADQQQYDFQTEKYRKIRAGEPLNEEQAAGFCQSGLWAKVRHPNYAAEQSTWLSFYLFSVAATGHWFNWSLTGVILLMLLFLGSSDFSEKISADKYPAYKAYQQRVARFIPFL